MSLIALHLLPENLSYFLFKKKMTIKEFAKVINEPYSTIFAISINRTKKAHLNVCQKIANAIKVPLETLQKVKLENLNQNEPYQIVKMINVNSSTDISKSERVGIYVTTNSKATAKSFAVLTNKKIILLPTIPDNCYVLLNPIENIDEICDYNIILLQCEEDIFFKIVHIKEQSEIKLFTLLFGDFKIFDMCFLSDLKTKYKILGKVIEIRHA